MMLYSLNPPASTPAHRGRGRSRGTAGRGGESRNNNNRVSKLVSRGGRGRSRPRRGARSRVHCEALAYT